MARLGLTCIVKNEAARIERMLASVEPYISAVCVTDTGSTDNTTGVVIAYCEAHRLPLLITDAPFENWSQARNANLDAAMGTNFGVEYWLLVDADMELKVSDRHVFDNLTGPSYDIEQRAGTCHYLNRRLVKHGNTARYIGPTHEYYDSESAGPLPNDKVFFFDWADGSNRPEKYKRDIRLLKAGLKEEPGNVRYMYYLAQSYRDAGDFDNAIKWFERRVLAGGWPEEQWNAQVNLAHCFKAKGKEAEFIRNMLIAYNMRPSRAETMYDLAKFYREKGMNAPGAAFAEIGMQIPKTTDCLFVNDYCYEVGCKEEFLITGFYVPGKRETGFKTIDEMSLHDSPYINAAECARTNMYHYLTTLKDHCPSFEWKKIDFTPPDPNYWTAMNPSVTIQNGELKLLVRTVNYRMDAEGRYIIKATDGTANAQNPIHTRNFLLKLDDDLKPTVLGEVLPTGNLDCKFPLVIGFEDMRIFPWNGELWSSSTVRQIHPDGNCEQVLARIGDDNRLTDMKRMLRQPRATEKNWSPIIRSPLPEEGGPYFMWRPGEIVNSDGNTVVKHPTGMLTDHISGSSQVTPYATGFLAITHEARLKPNSNLRYYYHRFVQYNADGSLRQFSRPFVFNDREIEFCAGMCIHPDGQRLVISYGFKDEEARIATVTAKDVEAFLCLK